MILYAIVGERPRGALGKGLRAVRAAGAWVVVGGGAPGEPSPPALRAFDRAIRRIEAPAMLPFRFGTTAASEAALAALLEPLEPALRAALERVRGCVQYTLRVYGESAPTPDPAGAGPGTRWLGARLALRRAPEIDPVTRATSAWVRASRIERHDRPPLVASVYHLVVREHARAYRLGLARSSRELRTVRVETSGPWPPYAFTEVL